MVTMAMSNANATLCLSVTRKSRPSSEEAIPVAATATAMLWSEIILPMTPVAAFVDAVRIGFNPRVLAVTTCKVPNKALDGVSLPVKKTPVHPIIALKNGNSVPVAAKARPNVDVIPA